MLDDDEVATFLERALEKARESDRRHLSALLKEVCVEAKRVPSDTHFSPTVEYLERVVTKATQRDFVVWHLNGNPNGGMNSPEAIRVALELSIVWAKSVVLKKQLDELYERHQDAGRVALEQVLCAKRQT